MAAPTCVVALHVLSPDLEPRSRRLSEYANGPYGYLMTLAFLTLGAGLLALAVALHDRRRRVWLPWPVPPGLAIAGIGMVVSGLFPTDPGSANSMRETIHSQASGLASVALDRQRGALAVRWPAAHSTPLATVADRRVVRGCGDRARSRQPVAPSHDVDRIEPARPVGSTVRLAGCRDVVAATVDGRSCQRGLRSRPGGRRDDR